MFAFFRRQSHYLAERWVALVGVTFLFAGCGPPTADQALKQAYKDNPSATAVEIAPFEGTVTVDGKPPSKPDTRMLVILNDPKHPQDPKIPPKLVAGCNVEGHFSFTTYTSHDGVQEGSYIVTFVELQNLSRPVR